MLIRDKFVSLEVFFPTHQILDQSEIVVKGYGQNIETGFPKNLSTVRSVNFAFQRPFERIVQNTKTIRTDNFSYDGP